MPSLWPFARHVIAGLLAPALILGALSAGANARDPVRPDGGRIAPGTMAGVVSVLPEWPETMRLPEAPEGSGVFVRDGVIATAAHVLGRAEVVRVRLADGRVLPVEIVGRDPLTDIALLRLDDADAPVFEMAPAPGLGGPVCAIGNPFGLGLSVSCGVVSARARSGVGFNPVEDFVQTDTVINPGSSGGALVDMQGRLVGMISAIFTKRSDADIGMNFAVSTALLDRVATELLETGRVARRSIGVTLDPVPPTDRVDLVDGAIGAVVLDVAPDGPAAGAGIARGDRIYVVGDRKVTEPTDVVTGLFLAPPDTPVHLRVASPNANGAAQDFGPPRTITLVPDAR